MNMEEDSETSTNNCLTNTNTNRNKNNIIREDDGEIEEYEPTDPDNFEAQITNISHHGPMMTWVTIPS
jgi:hypothetical protein